MIDVFAAGRSYLSAAPHSFWRWTDDAEAIAWADGKTIVFRQELVRVVRHLVPHGLPPLGAVLLLLAACRENWRQDSSELGILSGCLAGQLPLPSYLTDVLDGLDRLIHGLRPDLRSTPDVKAELAESFFDGWHRRVPPGEATDVLRALEQLSPDQIFSPARESRGPDRSLVWDLDCLYYGLTRFDPESFALRRQTGLEQMVEPAPAPELTPAQQARVLISQLKDDEELGGLARLARDLMAALTLPRALVDRDDLPVGGVSDISTRGTLDRLLLSELAHDDLTLAARVAVNEALYLRREAPPRARPRARTLFVDSGLRMWGMPRVFATAVALALAATGEACADVKAFRAHGRHVARLDFSRRQGIVDHLAALESAAHPGDALPALQAELQSTHAAAEVVLITGEDVWADREFRALLAESGLPGCYVAMVTRKGRLRLQAHSVRGSRLLREARLTLDEILTPAPRPPVLIDERSPLPAICKLPWFPLRLPSEPHYSRLWKNRAGVFGILRDGRLLHWDRPERGARQLAVNMPEGHVHWHSDSTHEDGEILAAVGTLSSNGLRLLRCSLAAGRAELISLDAAGGDGQPLAVTEHQGMLIVILHDRASMLEMSSGRFVSQVTLKGLTWHHGRVFRDARADRWHLLSHDGLSLRIEPLVGDRTKVPARMLTLLAPPGGEGCVGITRDFLLYHPAANTLERITRRFGEPIRIQATSHDGRRVALRLDRNQNLVLDVVTGHGNVIRGSAELLVELERGSVGGPVLRARFDAVGIDAQRNLVLVSPRGRSLLLDSSGVKPVLRLREAAPTVPLRTVPFGEPYRLPDSRITLRCARWQDGSQAILDSRGLLHLQSRNSMLPELTLVLSQHLVGGWSSDGRYFGGSYFWTEKPEELSVMWREILRPLLEELPC
jgi:hypothetical protein